MNSDEFVVLVDKTDRQTGTMEKMEAHQKGVLHRAVSVLVFNQNQEFLLQQRALHKYHSPGLWSNTCCSHPRPGESSQDAAVRRLQEEMGLSCPLEEAFEFTYRAEFDNGLTEHEFDHVFVGYSAIDPIINPEEAHSFRWMDPQSLIKDMKANPLQYTIWFRIILDEIIAKKPELIKN